MWPRIIIGAATCATFSLALAVVLFLRGCANEHYRPHGHIGISFGISPRDETLVFNAAGEGGRDLYLLDLTNWRVSRIAKTPSYEVDPGFTPDGKSFVYAAGKPGDRADHIFVGSLDGKTVTQLTTGDANDGTPECSPDGSLIVFARDRTYQWGGLAANWTDRVLCVMSIDGTRVRQLTNDGLMASAPHFSPDGMNILFSGMGGLYTIATDGSGSQWLVGDLNGRDAVYAPDGQSVAFSMGRYSPEQRIFVAGADGSRPKMVAHPSGEPGAHPRGGCTRPTFTHDGKRLFFFEESWPDGPTGAPKQSVGEIDLQGGPPRPVAGYGLFDDPLNWRPELPKPAEGP